MAQGADAPTGDADGRAAGARAQKDRRDGSHGQRRMPQSILETTALQWKFTIDVLKIRRTRVQSVAEGAKMHWSIRQVCHRRILGPATQFRGLAPE